MGTIVESSTSTFTVSTVPGGQPLGMENGDIPDSSITASSSAGAGPPHMARLNSPSAWCAGSADGCYLQVDLGSLHLICGVVTQGNPGGNRDFVKRYRLEYSNDGANWAVYDENGNDIIEGNTDNFSEKRKDLEQEVIARFVRFYPLDWYCWPCLRCEIYGVALNFGEKIQNAQKGEGGDGSYVVEKVLVTTYETHVQENGVNELDDSSLKEQEKKLIREAKERQRKEEEQQNRLEEIQFIIDNEEDKRRQSIEDMDRERQQAEERLKLVLGEEKRLEERKEELQQQDEDRRSRVTEEYSRIDLEHKKRMDDLTFILSEDEKRRQEEREEKRLVEEAARKKRSEERRQKEDEMRLKREEERLKWEEEHRKWEEERKRRDRELQEMLEEGRRKRAEERKKREEEARKLREEERFRRDEERRKRFEEEMRRLEEARKEREEMWNRRANVVISPVELTVQKTKVTENDEQNDKGRVEEKKKKEEGWIRNVETPRRIEEEMKKYREEERKRIEEEHKKALEKELEDAEKERELKSEIRVLKEEKPETITRVRIQEVHLTPAEKLDPGQEMRRIEWRLEKIERDRLLREEEEKRRQEEAERKRHEEEERIREEREKRRREEEEERERRKEELRLKREAAERERNEKRQEEEAKQLRLVEEKKKRLEEDRKKREMTEYLWRLESEERKRREEEEKRIQDEIKRKKRLSIERKKSENDEKKRVDETERKRSEEEERVRIEEERKRRTEREQWKKKQEERRKSGEIYRRKSEEDLRQRGERLAEKEELRKKRDSKNFETKWVFISGEYLDSPDSSFVSVSEQSTLETEPPDVFMDESPDARYVTVKNIEIKSTAREKPERYFRPIPATQPKEPSQVTKTTRVITTITRQSYSDTQEPKQPCASDSKTSLASLNNGDFTPYRSQPRCDHLLPDDPAVKEAEESSFFSKFDDNDPKLRPFPSWYGGLDMGSLPHLYFPTNPIQDPEMDRLLDIENEGLQSWKRIKKSGELEIYTRKGFERGGPPVYKAIMVLKDIPYRDAIELITDWGERSHWDKTFDGVSFLDQMGEFKILKCSQKKKNRCIVLATLDREEEEPYYAWAWKGTSHPGVPGEDPKISVMRLETEICGAIIRPYHDATRSCKITIITQVRGSVPSPLKSTYLTGNPAKWLVWLKKHHVGKLKDKVGEKEEEQKKKDDASSVSSKSDKQE